MIDVGAVLAGRYEVVRQLGFGGMSDVYLAHDERLDRQVAVKVMLAEYARDPTFVARFRREAEAIAALNHPNVVDIYAWGQEKGTYFIVMEHVDGQSLRDLLDAEGALDPDEAARIGIQIAGALAHAHAHGLVHRDVKPGNVLISGDGHVKVTDFGIVALAHDGGAGLTQTGAVMGTATYFSPEQAQGHGTDARTDLYALGVILYEMVVGHPPFRGDSSVAVAMQQVRERPVPPRRVDSTIPADFERIVLAALAKRPRDRYQSADDLADDLECFRRGRPLEHVPAAAPPAAYVGAPVSRERAPQPVALPRPESSARHPIARVLTVLAGIAVVTTAGIWAATYRAPRASGDVETKIGVPTVIGKTYDDAVAMLDQHGLRSDKLEDDTSPQAPGTVTQQDPPAGSKLAKGTVVRLTISALSTVVPDVRGKAYEAGAAALAHSGFKVERRDEDSPDKIEGTVLRTDPANGATADRGSVVRIYAVAQSGVLVPDVKGKTRDQATALLTAGGFRVQVVDDPSDDVEKDKAISTEPSPGMRVGRGTLVKLHVSSGPATVAVPNVVGTKWSDARAALLGAGFNVTVTCEPNGAGTDCRFQDHVVSAQSPGGGAQLKPGGTVEVTVP